MQENELQQEIEMLEKLASSGEGVSGGFQHKQRLLNFLNKQIEQKENSINEKKAEVLELNKVADESKNKLNIVNIYLT